MATETTKRATRLNVLRTLLLSQPERKWRTSEIAEISGVSPDTAKRDMEDLSREGQVPLRTSGSTANFVWEVMPGARIALPTLQLDYAQGVAAYAAVRLLSQQQDERNDHVRRAIVQIISILPEPLRPHLETLVMGMNAQEAGQTDRSDIFAILSQGWLAQRTVQLTYEPPQKRLFTCRFNPYLLEPSGIGYTLYFIGHSDPPGALRTFKLERIRHAELTDDSFAIPADFNGPALLRRAWHVMYGQDEPIHLKLRFSHFVSRRVRETRWHPSEQLSDTPEGLIWEADIGDVIEIKPWIRGWGADCEVLEPLALREELMAEIRRLNRQYGIGPTGPSTPANQPDQGLLNDLIG